MTKFLSPSALLFDMDGVLVDSMESWWKSLNDISEKMNNKSVSKETFIDQYWGYTLEKNLEKLGVQTENSKFCSTFYKKYVDEVVLFPDTKSTLEKLQQYPKAIITNTPYSCTDTILEKFQIKQFFDVIITSDSIKNGKPEPDIVYEACEQLDVRPEQVILIGDTQKDMKAGKTAGCTTIGINTDGDYRINHIHELLDIIDTSNKTN